MAICDSSIDSGKAVNARSDLAAQNEALIANSKARFQEGSWAFIPLDIGKPPLSSLTRACEDFAKNYKIENPEASIIWTQPVYCIQQPRTAPGTWNDIRGCLSLGKTSGDAAADLPTGRAFVWNSGEKPEFGDRDAIYLSFRVATRPKAAELSTS